jgi:transcriptional regulator with XRE-family HTH domain
MVSIKSTTQTDVLIGNRLRRRRLELHVSQVQVAEQLGVSFQQIQKYEKGVNRLSVGRLGQIAGILKTDLSYFMGDVDEGKKRLPTVSKLASFLATKDGVAINEAMIKLDEEHRRALIGLAQTLAAAYGAPPTKRARR